MSPLANRRKRDPVRNRQHQRDHYWRGKKCQASYGCDVDSLVLDMLVDRKYLGKDERDNAREIRLGISVFLADHAEAHHAGRPPPAVGPKREKAGST
jgi:hypothetical protein